MHGEFHPVCMCKKKAACAEKAVPLLTAASKASKLFKAQNKKFMVSPTATVTPNSPSTWSEFRLVLLTRPQTTFINLVPLLSFG